MIGSVRVSLDAIRRNAQALAALAAPSKTAFVVKSNAYGHGLIPVARAVEPLANRLCVYSIEEAVMLREAGIAVPVFVMGPVPEAALDEAAARRIEIALWDKGAYLRAAASAARARSARLAVHAKIDTGVARLGLRPEDAGPAIATYRNMPEIELTGVFSHLAAAEELDSPFTQTQLERFEGVTAAVEHGPIRHIAASAAAMLWPQTRLDMVRIGIALYGLWPSEQTRIAMNGARFELQPALEYRSVLAAVRPVEPGTPIGYGCSYHAPKATRIGVVPAGYADGIPRLLTNRGAFIVQGERCPIVGRVCMNMTMIDLERVPAARAGDTVTLLGRDGEACIGAADWAEWAATIDYEIVSRLPSELPRCWQ